VPLALSPYVEDPTFLDPEQINNFDYTETGGRCPFGAHVRKTAPRNLQPVISKEYLDTSVIVRAGIPYGEEVRVRKLLADLALIICLYRSRSKSAMTGRSSPMIRRRMPSALEGFSLHATSRPSTTDSIVKLLALPITTSFPSPASYLKRSVCKIFHRYSEDC